MIEYKAIFLKHANPTGKTNKNSEVWYFFLFDWFKWPLI